MASQPQINTVLSLAICKAKSKSLPYYGLSSTINCSIPMASDKPKHEGVLFANARGETKHAHAFSHQCLHPQKDIDDEMPSMFSRANEFHVTKYTTLEADSTLAKECKEDCTRGWINTQTRKTKVQDCGTDNESFGREKRLTFLKKILREFFCAICKNVLKQPVSTLCGHSFCKSCLFPITSDRINRHHRYGVNGRPLRILSVGKSCPLCQEDVTKFLLNAQVNWQMEAAIQHLKRSIAEIGNARFEEDNTSREKTTIKEDGFQRSKDDILSLPKTGEENGVIDASLRKKPIIEEKNRDKNSDHLQNMVKLKEGTYDPTKSKLLPTFTSENGALHQEKLSGATCKQPEDCDKKSPIEEQISFERSMLSAFCCGLCKKRLESPLSTPCGHYFCKNCLSLTFGGQADAQKRFGVYGRPLRSLKVLKRCPCCQADINSYLINLQVIQEVKNVFQPLVCNGIEEKMEASTNRNMNSAEKCQSFRSHESNNWKGKSTPDSVMAKVVCQDLSSLNVYKRRHKDLPQRGDSSKSAKSRHKDLPQRGNSSKSANQTKEGTVEPPIVVTNGVRKYSGGDSTNSQEGTGEPLIVVSNTVSKHSGNCRPRQESKKEHSRWQRLVKDFGCALCKKVLKLPLTTPCGHNFCKPCLLGVFSGQDDIRKRYGVYGRSLRVQRVLKRCPSCQEDISTYFIDLQVNTELLKCVEWLGGKATEEGDSCLKPGDGSEEVE